MTSTLDVLDAMDVVLQSIDGLRVADYKATNVVPPMAYTAAPDIPTYNDTYDGGYMPVFQIVLLVSPTEMRAAERQLIAFTDPAGDQSIYAAFNADQTLGGIVQNIYVESFARFDAVIADTIGYPGGTFNVPVML